MKSKPQQQSPPTTGPLDAFTTLFSPSASPSESEEDAVCRNVSCKTAVSTLTLRPTPRDDGAAFACEAEHPAIGGGARAAQMRAAVVLSVQCE